MAVGDRLRFTQMVFPDYDSVIDMITSTVHPVTWDDVGGPGTIVQEELRGLLIVSQTREVHDALSNLLTLLRRSRYELLCDERPWLWAAPSPDRPLIAPWPEVDEPAPRMSELPQPNAEELAALAGRRAQKIRDLAVAANNSRREGFGRDHAVLP